MTHWTLKRERGSAWLIHLVVWLARRVGRTVCRVLLYPIVLYFFVTDAVARQSSAEFLQAARGTPTRRREVFANIYAFAATLLDRVYMATGNFDRFDITIEGLDLVDRALLGGRGCVLLGSHLGSFDLLMLARRALGERRVNVMMRLDPRSRVRRIAGMDDGTVNLIALGRPDSYLRAQEALARGEIVALLADRVDGPAHLPVRFLGRLTVMPIAPHVLAARCEAPTLMFFGIYESTNRYRIEFVECGAAAARSSRGAALQPAVDAYVAVLERYGRRYPSNWFNFYPYWPAPQGGA